MLIIKKILLLLVFIIFLYVLWQLIILRINLKKELNKPLTENFQEGLSLSSSSLFSSNEKNELSTMTSTFPILIKNMNKTKNLKLRDYCIKSSYNTAVSGNYVSTDTISYIISRGVRYLDFEIFYIDLNVLNNNNISSIANYEPVVGYSTDSTYVQLNTLNIILLQDALTTAISKAFISSTPNNQDPLIINLRIKSNNQDVYSSVAKCIDNNIYSNLYVDPNDSYVINDGEKANTRNVAKKITKDTRIFDIMGSLIISLDITYFPNYENAICEIKSDNTCKYLLHNYINIENGGSDMILSIYDYLINKTTIVPNKDGTTNIDNIYVAVPNPKLNNSNPSFGDLLLKFGYPIIPYQFYLFDSELEDYEKFFNDNKSAFVPLADSITYFKRNIPKPSNRSNNNVIQEQSNIYYYTKMTALLIIIGLFILSNKQ